MASGNISPRQKMINMMYLVLTAMLALNVSKDILRVLAKLDLGMNATVTTVERGTATLYQAIQAQVSENPRAIPINERAIQVKAKSDEIFSLLATTKEEMIKLTGGVDEEGRYKGADNRDIPENFLLNDKSIGGQGKAKEIKEKLTAFRAFLEGQSDGDATMKRIIDETFTFEDEVVEGKKMSWERATFAELPLAGVVPFLTDLQSRVRRMEAKTIEHLYGQIDANTLKFDNVKAVIMPISTYVTQGDYLEADVFLAAYDKGRNPEFIGVTPQSIENGVGKIRIQGTGNGTKVLKGAMRVPGGDTEYPFELSYTVAPPSVVISATAMNVVYRGLDNPLEVSVPGVSPQSLIVSGPGLKGSNGNYILDGNNVPTGTNEITISVSVKDNDGKVRKAGSKVYRVKRLPPTTGSVSGVRTGTISSQKLSKGIIDAKYEDFPFDLKLTVNSFEIKVNADRGAQRVTGNKIPSDLAQSIERLKPGSTVTIRNIKATTPKGSTVSVADIVLDIN
jgi:gliding motility-associated protein GldM